MARVALPGFISELFDDRASFRALIASTLVLLAAGIVPRVMSPAVGDVQTAIRQNPEIQSLATLTGVVAAGALLVGGVAGDAFRSRRIVLLALGLLVVTALVSLVIQSGPLFTISRAAGGMGAGLAIPFAIATSATVYSGNARATAIGIAYAGYGAGTALPPLLLTVTGPNGNDWPAYLAAAAAALVALRLARYMPDLPGAREGRLGLVSQLAIWAFGIIAITAGLAAVGGGLQTYRVVTIALGIGAIAIALVQSRRARNRGVPFTIDRRAVTVVLVAGLVLGFAQTTPMLLLPTFFELILRFNPLLAVAATAPFILALLLAGPVAGALLPRFSPRGLIAGGLVAVGLGDLLVAWLISANATYLVFIMPFILVGAGFVIGTTVRTAVIFASVPRDLPASAAALNEASVGLGSQIGVATGIVLLAQFTLSAFSSTLPPGTNVAAALAPLNDLLVAIGTPNFPALVQNADTGMLRGYAEAYVEGLRVVHLVSALLAVAASVFAWIGLRHRERISSVWSKD